MASLVYASVVEADQYNLDHDQRASWTAAAPDAKDRALTKSTDYLDEVYEKTTQGDRVLSTQARAWFRAGAFLYGFLIPTNVLPLPLKESCIEMAFRFLDGSVPFPDRVGGEASPIKITAKRLGSLSKTIEYTSGDDGIPRFALIELKMAPLLVARDRMLRR